MAAALLAVDRGRHWGWESPGVVGAAGLSMAAAVALVAVERRAADPFVPPALLRQRPVRAVLVARFLADFAYVGVLLAASLLLRGPLGYPASAAAAVLLLPTVLFSVAGPLFGHLEGRWRRRGPALADPAELGAAVAAIQTASQVGGAVGVGVAGTLVVGAATPGPSDRGWREPAGGREDTGV